MAWSGLLELHPSGWQLNNEAKSIGLTVSHEGAILINHDIGIV